VSEERQALDAVGRPFALYRCSANDEWKPGAWFVNEYKRLHAKVAQLEGALREIREDVGVLSNEYIRTTISGYLGLLQKDETPDAALTPDTEEEA
jgi:hypothetical protein